MKWYTNLIIKSETKFPHYGTKFWASDNWDLGILASLSLVWSSQIGFKGSGNKELQNGKVCKTNIKKYAQKNQINHNSLTRKFSILYHLFSGIHRLHLISIRGSEAKYIHMRVLSYYVGISSRGFWGFVWTNKAFNLYWYFCDSGKLFWGWGGMRTGEAAANDCQV